MNSLTKTIAYALGEKSLELRGHGLSFADEYSAAALTAIEQAGSVVVPKEPTEAMRRAGRNRLARINGQATGYEAEHTFVAMIEAATRDESHDQA